MENISTYSLKKRTGYLLLNSAILTFIYFVPAISHLLNIPIYLYDPMRVMLFIGLIFSSKNNSYLIALSLPFFSYIISSHPSIIKSSIITVELLLNVFLFYWLKEKFSNHFIIPMLSIVLSKIVYYLLKFILISFAFIEGDVISTPIYFQIITIIILNISTFGINFYRDKKI
ncbi:MAG TPA: hypothetical protein VLN45_05130 [Ignavibacteriaceae bacterium]|nr:hypothetical protein [Ignavibacteriaceae bacterium]